MSMTHRQQNFYKTKLGNFETNRYTAERDKNLRMENVKQNGPYLKENPRD